ncbi:MAG: D-glycero-beta-D-manno-heptose 1-phosphate adenylyltransferase [Deltaproteobacteria bacterium]|nr:D-glycero-beta-D-manno-heptose 1-phosphate adenylyltransferase [Deltaproteobacteria bacterium]
MNRTDSIQAKILNEKSLGFWLARMRFKNRKIVFTNGCFDILHPGHIFYLSKAADSGDVLIIGLNSDASVKKLKGEGRPVMDQYSRAMLLASLCFVSAVVLFEEDTPYRLIQAIQPDILVKGSDYKAEEIVGYDIVKSRGGEVLTIDFVEGYSSSSIRRKIADNQ